MRDRNQQLYFSVNEVSVFLGLTRQTVYRYIKLGHIKSVKYGKTLRIPRSEISLQVFLERAMESFFIAYILKEKEQ